MLLFPCALFAFSLGSLVAPPATNPEARQLYTQAADALRAGTHTDAIPPLRQLIQGYPDSPLSVVSAPHLAECLLAEKDASGALQTLLDWYPRIVQSAEAKSLEPALSDRSLALVRIAVGSLSMADLELLEEQLALSDFINALHPDLHSILLRELAAVRQRQHQYESAIHLLEQLGDRRNEREQNLLQFDFPFAAAHQQLERGSTEQAIEQLRTLNNKELNFEQRVATRFELAEALRISHNLTESLAAFEELAILADQHWENDRGSGPILDAELFATPEWRATVELRRGEILVLLGKHQEARALMRQAQLRFQQFDRHDEFGFLLARASIADIEFGLAQQQLKSIVEAAKPDDASRARALWMLGEISMMQRDYRQAIALYSEVISMVPKNDWQVRALLQLGKCQELTRQPVEAAMVYRQIISQFADSDLADEAAQRLIAVEQRSQVNR